MLMRFIINTLATEKAVSAIERENKITFIVRGDATKLDVKKEVEGEYKEKVVDVKVMFTPTNKKKAIVRLQRAGAAADLAARLKVI